MCVLFRRAAIHFLLWSTLHTQFELVIQTDEPGLSPGKNNTPTVT